MALNLYHCTHNKSLADGPLQVPDDALFKGLFFAHGSQDQYGDETYRTHIPSRNCFLHDDILHQLSWSDRVEWTETRDGQALPLTRQDLEVACRDAMTELEIDPDLFDSVWECAIEDASCSADEALEDLEGWSPYWTLQNVRGLTAQKVGLAGAEMEDDTGISYMLMGELPLEKVEYDADHSLADEDGFVVVKANPMRQVEVARDLQRQQEANTPQVPRRIEFPDLNDDRVLDQAMATARPQEPRRGMRL
jgi:hypothetical protein